ncbi:MAG: hypothetical protein AAFZ58_00660 [Pseudomonadota bacterium]
MRTIACCSLLGVLASAGCGYVPPVPLFDAPPKPSPATSGIVYYGETIGPQRSTGDVIVRKTGADTIQFSERAVVVLPAGDYEFSFPLSTGRVVSTEQMVGGALVRTTVYEPDRMDIAVTVEAGTCYRIYQVDQYDADKIEMEEYYPADRADLKDYCPPK